MNDHAIQAVAAQRLSGLSQEELAPLSGQSWYQQGVQPVLLAGLVTALTLGPILVVRLLAGRPFAHLTLVVFVVALEGILTTRWLAHPDRRGLNRYGYRAAELVVIAVAMRLVAWIVSGDAPTAADLRSYIVAPTSFVDGAYLLLLVMASFAWERAIGFSAVFAGLVLSSDEVTYYSMPEAMREHLVGEMPPESDRMYLVGRFIQQWAMGGLLIILCAALTTFELPRLLAAETANLRTLGRLGLHPTMLAALLGYFGVGFWLVSQARLAALRVRWLTDGLTAEAGIARRWERTSLLVVLGVGLVASLLPIGRTVALAYVLEALLAIVFLLFNVLLGLMALVIYFLLSLLGRPQGEEALAEEPARFMPPDLGLGGEASQAAQWVFGSLFWLVALGVTVAAAVFFLRNRGAPLNVAVFSRLWEGLVEWWRGVWGGVAGRMGELGMAVRARLQARAGTPAERRWRFVRLNGLTAQEQVRYFYLAMTRRAGEQGVKRRPDETPLEYAGDLEAEWPEVKGGVEELTEAFVKARYSPRPTSREEVSPVKRRWQQVKAQLRRRRG